MSIQFYPGDLICLKKTYRGAGHPDDFIVGIVISKRGKKMLIAFSERTEMLAMETISIQEFEIYYMLLKRKDFLILRSMV